MKFCGHVASWTEMYN